MRLNPVVFLRFDIRNCLERRLEILSVKEPRSRFDVVPASDLICNGSRYELFNRYVVLRRGLGCPVVKVLRYGNALTHIPSPSIFRQQRLIFEYFIPDHDWCTLDNRDMTLHFRRCVAPMGEAARYRSAAQSTQARLIPNPNLQMRKRNKSFCARFRRNACGGEGGIRTHGTRKGSTVFETARFNHSRTSPDAAFKVPNSVARLQCAAR